MPKPALTEKHLTKLVDCLVANFRAVNGIQTGKLDSYKFSIADRSGYVKVADLIFHERVINTNENSFVILERSLLLDAVKELAARGLVVISPENPLLFTLSATAVEQAAERAKLQNRTRFQKAWGAVRNHPILTFLGSAVVIAFINFFTAILKFVTELIA